MSTARELVKKQIILATISSIEKEGINSVTTRKVAKEAGVNIAAINYYFGSKEELLRGILGKTLKHFLQDTELILAHKDLSPYSLFKVFLTFILSGSLQYPNMMKALLNNNLYNAGYSEKFFQQFKLIVVKAENLIMQSSNNRDHRKARVSLMQMVNTVLTPGITLSIQKKLFGLNLSRQEDLLFYIEELLHHYIPQIKGDDIKKEESMVDSLLEQIFNSPDSVWET